MKTGKLFALAAGYIAGLIIAIKFGKNGKSATTESIKKDIENIHKNLWTEAEATIFSPENREKVAEMRAKAEAEIAEFKKEANAKLKEWKKAGNEKKEELMAEAEELYARREELLEDAKKAAIDAFDSGKETSEKNLKDLVKKTEKIAKEMKKELEGTFKDLKKKAKSKGAKK